MEEFEKLATTFPKEHRLHNETVYNISRVALQILKAEYQYRANDNEWELSMRNAIRIEDSLVYDEPPPWTMPARQTMGALQNEPENTMSAIANFASDLEKWPKNVWSMAGLNAALKKINIVVENKKVQKYTDSNITTGCACATTHWNTKTIDREVSKNMALVKIATAFGIMTYLIVQTARK